MLRLGWMRSFKAFHQASSGAAARIRSILYEMGYRACALSAPVNNSTNLLRAVRAVALGQKQALNQNDVLIDETLFYSILGASSSHGTKRENREFLTRRKRSPLTLSPQNFSFFERFLADFAPEFPENEREKRQHLQPSPSLVAFP